MHPVLAFILGFLFGIIALLGAVAGAVYFALNYKLDKISANKDGEGNYIYINADPESGGVENALDLIKKVTELSKDTSSLTIGAIENLLPAASKLTGAIKGALDQYVEIDMEALKQVAIPQLGNYLQDILMDIRPASLIEKFAGNLADNVILKAVLYDGEGEPVTLRDLTSGDALSALYGKKIVDLIENADAIVVKILGAIVLGDLINGNVDFKAVFNDIEFTEFVDVDPSNGLMVYMGYGIRGLRGKDGELRGTYTLADGTLVDCYIETGLSENGNKKITEAYYFDEEGNKVTIRGTTINDINSRVEHLMDELTVPDIIVVKPPVESDKNTIMLFLAYSVSSITAEAGDGYSYVGLYNPAEGESEKCYIFTDETEVTDVCVVRGGEYVSVAATTINGVSKQVSRITNTLKIKDVININENDKLMNALGDYVISEVGNAILNDITIGEFLDIDESNTIMKAISGSTVSSLPEDINRLTVNELYADSIYSSDTNSDETVEPYLAVEVSSLYTVQTYRAGLIYYVKNGEDYSLAGTTGKLENFEDGVEYYTAGAGKIVFDTAYLYYTKDENERLTMTAERGKVSAFEDGTYYTYGAANATWKLLVYSDGEETACSVNELSAMINNVKANIQKTTMAELDEAGVVDMGANLKKKISWKTAEGKIRTEEIGKLTLEELLNAIVAISETAPSIP